MGIRICTDVGGTFTDSVIIDDERGVQIFKALTTRHNPVDGMVAGLQLAACAYELSLEEFLGRCTYFGHGSTVATNAVIEGKVARVGLICTRGFRDILLFREGGKENPFDWDLDYPEPYVPRFLTLGVAERVNAEGGIEVPLRAEDVAEAVAHFRRHNVQAIAVALLWSVANPTHELRVAELIQELWPGVHVALSHVVNPILGEYRRSVCAAIDASLKPLISGYVNGFEHRLRDLGFRGTMSLLSSSGGVISPAEMLERPIFSLDSGPALAPVAGRFYGTQELGVSHIITFDMGGTSFDVSRVTEGVIAITHDAWLGHERLAIPKVDTKSIGAGGGSIAWVDEGSLLRVGPEGAGSDPGPVCYGRGGTRATVTDANLVLGYLDPAYFLGGAIQLDRAAAERAIREQVAAPLGLDPHAAAHAVWTTVGAQMTEAIRDITVWEGIDPREYFFVSGGGAAAIHSVHIVRELGARQMIIPKTAAALSAFGGVIANYVREFHRGHFSMSQGFDFAGVNEILRQLEAEARAFLSAAGFPAERQQLEFSVLARYPFQDRGLPVALQVTRFEGAADVRGLVEDFHVTHDRTLGAREPGSAVEFLLWRVRAIGLTPEFQLREWQVASNGSAAAARKANARPTSGRPAALWRRQSTLGRPCQPVSASTGRPSSKSLPPPS